MPRFRPRLRFSLRTLFVLVTLLCVWLGWNLQIVRVRKSLVVRLQDSALFIGGSRKGSGPFEMAAEVSWLRMRLGDHGILLVRLKRENAHETEAIQAAFPEAQVELIDFPIPSLTSPPSP